MLDFGRNFKESWMQWKTSEEKERKTPRWGEVDIIICFSVGSYNKNQKLGGLEMTEIYFSVLEAGRPRSGSKDGQILMRTLLQAAGGWLFLVFSQGGEQSRSSRFCLDSCKGMNPIHEGFILKTSSTSNYLFISSLWLLSPLFTNTRLWNWFLVMS